MSENFATRTGDVETPEETLAALLAKVGPVDRETMAGALWFLRHPELEAAGDVDRHGDLLGGDAA